MCSKTQVTSLGSFCTCISNVWCTALAVELGRLLREILFPLLLPVNACIAYWSVDHDLTRRSTVKSSCGKQTVWYISWVYRSGLIGKTVCAISWHFSTFNVTRFVDFAQFVFANGCLPSSKNAAHNKKRFAGHSSLKVERLLALCRKAAIKQLPAVN